jgi:hypothetical protein
MAVGDVDGNWWKSGDLMINLAVERKMGTQIQVHPD